MDEETGDTGELVWQLPTEAEQLIKTVSDITKLVCEALAKKA